MLELFILNWLVKMPPTSAVFCFCFVFFLTLNSRTNFPAFSFHYVMRNGSKPKFQPSPFSCRWEKQGFSSFSWCYPTMQLWDSHYWWLQHTATAPLAINLPGFTQFPPVHVCARTVIGIVVRLILIYKYVASSKSCSNYRKGHPYSYLILSPRRRHLTVRRYLRRED